MLAAGWAPHPLAAVVLLSLCLAAEQFTDAIYWAAAISVAGRRASAACGLMNTGGNLSGGVVALVVPLVVDRFGWPAALATGSAFALVAAALWLVTSADVTWMSGIRSRPRGGGCLAQALSTRPTISRASATIRARCPASRKLSAYSL